MDSIEWGSTVGIRDRNTELDKNRYSNVFRARERVVVESVSMDIRSSIFNHAGSISQHIWNSKTGEVKWKRKFGKMCHIGGQA